MFKENWLRYDEPSLRWTGNKDLFENDIVIYSEEEIWDLLRAKKFPLGDENLAGKKLPGNDFIEYLLKIKTVFRKRIKLVSGEHISAIFMSNSLSKDEVLEEVNNSISD